MQTVKNVQNHQMVVVAIVAGADLAHVHQQEIFIDRTSAIVQNHPVIISTTRIAKEHLRRNAA